MLVARYEEVFHHLILDCSPITLVDSHALGEIVAGYYAIVRRSGGLRLLQTSNRLRELLKIPPRESLLETFEDERTATLDLSFRAGETAKEVLDAFLH